MYESHFGLSGPPFQLVPDPSFYFSSKGHSNALAFLKFGAHQGEGFIVVTGEIGAGKTTLVRTLLDGLDPASVVAAPVISTQLEAGELPMAILMAFGAADGGDNKAQMLVKLEAFLTDLSSKGRRALLIVDEAQNLPVQVVEELRLLTNFQLGKNAMLQVFLVGQPELRTMLQSKAMDQMRQRVTASCHLGPLDPAESRAYVEHRLHRVGWTDRPAFELDAFQQLHRWTGGIPRRINRLCNRLLLAAFLEGKEKVTPEDVEQIAADLRTEIGESDELQPMSPSSVDAPRQAAGTEASMPAATHDKQPPADDVPSAPIGLLPLSDTATAPERQDAAPATPRSGRETAKPPGAKPPVPGVVAEHEASTPASSDPEPARAPVHAPVHAAGLDEKTIPVLRESVAERLGTEPPTPVQVAPTLPAEPAVPAAAPAPSVVAMKKATSAPESGVFLPDPNLAEPIVCLVDSVADYVKARALARGLADHPKLPAVMTVHIGSAASLAVGEGLAGVMPAAPIDVHLGVEARGGVEATAEMLLAFGAVLKEHRPSAVLAMGASDSVLTCGLLAHKAGIPVLRNDAGRRRAWAWTGEEMNSMLLERFADISYITDLATYYTLYRVGIATDKVLCVGDLADDVVRFAAEHTMQPDEVLRRVNISTAPLKSQRGYALATTRILPRGDAQLHTEELVAGLCKVGKALPVLWAVDEFTAKEVLDAGLDARLSSANVVLVPSLGYIDCLDLLRRARCLIAGSSGECLDEAVALGVPTLVLGKDIVVPVKPTESMQPNVAQGVDKLEKLLAEVLAVKPSERHKEAEARDGGTSARIAAHLEAWLPKEKKARARQARVAKPRPQGSTAPLAHRA